MKLKQLEIQGFKSFPDRTTLKFDQSVTGIVGPNGCGKSNVIDAFRWVLGEQRTTSLRSDKMENIIFNGTQKRHRNNLAEVAITFENTRNLLPTEYETVTIRRKLYRDGSSEYQLNDVPCRLKDINNLLLDTGIGPDSYAIIELAMVDDLLKDKNNARRQIFEQAAGIAKYKVRKKETQSRLDETDQSLERVEDLLYEIEDNLKKLERQAQRAQRYFELKEQYRVASYRASYLEAAHLQSDLAQLKKQIQDKEDQLQKLQTQTREQDAKRSEMQRDLADREQALSDYQRKVNAYGEEIQQLESQKNLENERLKHQREREQELRNTIQQKEANIERLQQAQHELESQIDEANEVLDQRSFELAELEQELEDLRKAVKNRQTQVDELNNKLKSKEQNRQQLEKDQGYVQAQLSSLRNELNRNQEEQGSRQADAQSFASQIADKESAIDEKQKTIDHLEAQDQEHRQHIDQLELDLQSLQTDRAEKQRRHDAEDNEYQLTKSLVENLEGFPESVKFLKKQPNWAADPALLSDIFLCPADYKLALENYLEPFLNYYVVKTRAEALQGIHLLADASQGRANFLILDELPAPNGQPPALPQALASYAQPVLSLLEYDSVYERLAQYLFRGVYFMQTMQGLATTALPEGLTLIDQQGALLLRSGTAGGGSVGLFQGKRIGRARNLERLGESLKQLRLELKDLDNKIEKKQTALEHEKAALKQLPIASRRQELNELQQELSVLQTRASEYEAQVQRMSKREADIQAEIQKLEQQEQQNAPKIAALQDEIHQLQQELNTLQRELNERNQKLSDLNQRYNQANAAYYEAKNQVDNLKRSFRENNERMEQDRKEITNSKSALSTTQQTIQELQQTSANADEDIRQRYEHKAEMDAELRKYEERVSQLREKLQELEDATRNERKQQDELREALSKQKDRQTRLEVRRENINQHLDYEFQTSLEQLSAEAVFGEQEPEAFELEKLQQEVKSCREQLNKFGEVNTAAIDSYNEVKERYDFIEGQRQDLLRAKEDLLQTMQQIDETARTQFLETFEQISANFQRVFTTLFSEGDTCEVRLKDPDQPLDSPIEIMAKPKGKRPLTISQLSGGEKTLTAISMLFAVYLIKPAPFCIFDEVDAPLDDANIDKFNNIIKDFAGQSQFVLVTHNKRTMAETEVMYGVTMEESGVSRVLPVDLKADIVAQVQQ